MSRVRTRSFCSPALTGWWTMKYLSPDGLWNQSASSPAGSSTSSFTSTETIVDEVGKRSFRGEIRNVQHSKSISRVPLLTIGGGMPLNPNVWETRGCTSCVFQLTSLPFVQGLTPANVTVASTLPWRSNAFKSFTEQVPRKVSLPNFILELDDLPRMIKNLSGLLGRGLSSARAFRGTKPSKRAGKVANKDYLEVQFGLAPFIRDLQDITNSISDYQKRIKWLKKTKGVPTTVRRRLVTTDASPWTAWSAWSSAAYGIWGAKLWTRYRSQRVVTTTTVVGATMRHNLKGLDDFLSLSTGYLDMLGFNRPASIIWEAIPFSWLVDYFVRFGDLLEDIKTSNPFSGDITISNTWTSVKTVTQVVGEVEYYISVQGNSPTSSKQWIQSESTTYSRSKGVDTSAGLVGDTNLTLDQYLNIIALLT